MFKSYHVARKRQICTGKKSKNSILPATLATRLLRSSFLFHTMATTNDYKELTTTQRQCAFLMMWSHSREGSTTPAIVTTTANLFKVTKNTIRRLWRETMQKVEEEQEREAGNNDFDLYSLLTTVSFYESGSKRRGRKIKWDRDALKTQVRDIPLKNRRNWKELSCSTGIPKTTLHHMFRSGTFRRHSSSLKPLLSEQNKLARLEHALDEVDPVSLQFGDDGDGPMFKDFMDRIDVDEKWFYLSYDGENYILVDDGDEEEGNREADPVRRTRHKGYISKVLFLCATARPRWDPHRKTMFDGKIGIWPVGEYLPAQRTSSNRPAGTLVWRNISITRDRYRNMLLTLVVPAIIERWPRNTWSQTNFILRIQQDGPNTHISPDDVLFQEGLEKLGVENKILIYTQPANSPDTNINDLGFFRALEAEYRRYKPNDEQEIIHYVQRAYSEYNPDQINKIWLSLMAVYNEIIDSRGDNNFPIPHLGKAQMDRNNNLPVVLPVTDAALTFFE